MGKEETTTFTAKQVRELLHEYEQDMNIYGRDYYYSNLFPDITNQWFDKQMKDLEVENKSVRQKPNIKTKVVHSITKDAWNVVGIGLGEKYKISRVPYVFMSENCITSVRNKAEALEHAMFISHCFNYPEKVTY